MWICSIAIGLALSLPRAAQDGAQRSAQEVSVLTHAELQQALTDIESAHGQLASLHNLGTSRGGRSLDALRITAVPDAEQAPALLLIANLEGPRVFESGVALHHAQVLTAGYATDERIQALLDSTVVWIVPRANPDAAEGHFDSPGSETWNAASGVDNDRDARVGEDGPMDVNRDGLQTRMRVLDPDGEWMQDPTDARVLVKADKSQGQVGRWKLYDEARDQDGDGQYGEDPMHDTRMDRNFPAGWEEHAAYAGLYPTHEPEVLALCEFVMAQKNLALVVSYDGLDNLVEAPKTVGDRAPAVKRVPPPGVLESDGKLLLELGKRYRKATGNESKGSGELKGSFSLWCYDHRGLFTLDHTLWNMPLEAPKTEEAAEEASPAAEKAQAKEPSQSEADSELKPSEEAKRLRWIDGSGEAWRFIDWTPFEHPELGPLEIGGMAPYALFIPPADEWSSLAEADLEWVLGLGALLPRLRLAECSKELLAAGLYRVTAVVQNDAFLPLLSRSAQRTRTTRPARVRIELPEGAELLGGSRQQLLSELDGSGGRAEFSWLVQASDRMKLQVSVDSDHAGRMVQMAEVVQ